MQATLSLEERLSDANLKSYIQVFNHAFEEMMAHVGYTRAALYVRDNGKAYAFTFFGDGKQISGYESGINGPEILLDIKGENLTSLLDKYNSRIDEIMEKPDDVVRELAPELSKFTIVVNRELLVKSLQLVGKLAFYVLKKYGVNLKMLMAKRPIIKYQKIDGNYES